MAATAVGLSPQTQRRPELQSAEARHRYVRELFDATAPHYDRINALMSLGTGAWYRRRALGRVGIGPGDRVLDVGCGTGVIAATAQAMVGPKGRVVGLDPSPAMLEVARRRGLRETVVGVADALPFDDASFDTITMGYALRHVDDLDSVFGEYARVLRPGGRVVLLEMTRPTTTIARPFFGALLGTIVPAVSTVACGSRRAGELMRYFHETIQRCVEPAAIVDALDRAGFRQVRRRVELGVLSEYAAAKPPAAIAPPGRRPSEASCPP